MFKMLWKVLFFETSISLITKMHKYYFQPKEEATEGTYIVVQNYD